jgi:LmbE family N-acetylglucosaminyl deacetylase
MKDRHPSRRQFLDASFLAIPVLAVRQSSGQARPSAGDHQQRVGRTALNIVCLGAHPDDPESGCGGTLARYAAAGHRVTIIYLTRGERGIPGRALDEAGRIRTAEAEQACRILGAASIFAGQIDGATEVNTREIDRMISLVRAAQPDVVFTHWPIDSHPDHQAASLLAIRAWYALKRSFPLYFFEVNAGSQTIAFRPTTHVDVTTTRDAKRRALAAHQSQRGDEIYRIHHEPMERFRGREIGADAAEAFIQLDRSGELPAIRVTNA